MAVSACSTNFAKVQEIIPLDRGRRESAIASSHVRSSSGSATCSCSLPRADGLAELAPVRAGFDLCGEVFELAIDRVQT